MESFSEATRIDFNGKW